MLIFGLDMSSSVHIDSKKKNILVLGIGPTQGLEHALTAEKMYEIKFTVKNKKFCLNLHYNGANSYLFVNGTEIYNLKQKILKLQQAQYALEISQKLENIPLEIFTSI